MANVNEDQPANEAGENSLVPSENNAAENSALSDENVDVSSNHGPLILLIHIRTI